MLKKKVLLSLFIAFAFGSLRAQIILADPSGTGGNYLIPSYPGNFTGVYDGFTIIFKANHNNPAGVATMNVNSMGARPIVNTAGNTLGIDDIRINQIVLIVYDATNVRYQMLTTSGNAGGGSGWNILGNSGTADGTNFIGNTDDIPFSIRVNNQRSGYINRANSLTFFGYEAGLNNSGAANNSAFGYQSLKANTTGQQNTAVGYEALHSSVAGNGATALGYRAMSNANNTGTSFTNSNVAIGYEALRGSATQASNTGVDNTAVGYQALWVNTSGYSNVAYGMQALYSNSTGFWNTANGFQSLYFNTIGVGNTATGHGSLFSNNTGGNNTATGYNSLYSNTSGSQNTANGVWALLFNTTASRNTAVGHRSLYTQSFSNAGSVWNSDNVAIGYDALYSNQPTSTANGIQNTAVGNETMYSNVNGSGAVAIGYQALYNKQQGANNIAIGNQAYFGNAGGNGSNIIAIGYRAGYNLTSGNSSILIGHQAGDNITSGANNIIVGHDIDAPIPTGNQQLSIGNLIFGTGVDGIGTTISTGNVGIGTTTPQNKLDVEGAAVIGSTYSGSNAAPTNGLLVEGNVGIGTTNPGANRLQVEGTNALFYNPSGPMTVTIDGTLVNASQLIVNGKVQTNTFQMTNAPTAGAVLTSDATGNGTWTNNYMVLGTVPNSIATGTFYSGPYNTGNNAAESTRQMVCPSAFTVNRMYVFLATAQPAGVTTTITLRRNATDTPVVLTINPGTAIGVYSAIGTSQVFAPGDLLSFKLISGGGASGTISSLTISAY